MKLKKEKETNQELEQFLKNDIGKREKSFRELHHETK